MTSRLMCAASSEKSIRRTWIVEDQKCGEKVKMAPKCNQGRIVLGWLTRMQRARISFLLRLEGWWVFWCLMSDLRVGIIRKRWKWPRGQTFIYDTIWLISPRTYIQYHESDQMMFIINKMHASLWAHPWIGYQCPACKLLRFWLDDRICCVHSRLTSACLAALFW
jgi:hypothetical protein